MKDFLTKYGAALGFLLRFLGVYIVLTMAYTFYINQFTSTPDGITTLVANQSKWLLDAFGYPATMVKDAAEPFYKVMVGNHYTARIVEGCNSVSVLILFVTFIIAFKGSLKHTLLYGLAGIAFLYVVNVLRIVILTIGVYELPTYTHTLHGLVFPAIIYGTMLVLWVFWVRRFAKK
ncbi:exosortase family protein XrtF [Neptunitalea lumnitzerae]|uniref:Exosortase family protein XrtF n=1 Tax=Neptunitalea lumnitzerae TaxID=2965509 RepID=A0ABQ5MGM9_9FLAO|nr:exosortase family protein XrtF [Neptunitalea sp. Y10]GLB48554.1 exosortase family protein XrtF [Neptunitalea sp. Y10]